MVASCQLLNTADGSFSDARIGGATVYQCSGPTSDSESSNSMPQALGSNDEEGKVRTDLSCDTGLDRVQRDLRDDFLLNDG